MKRVIISDTHIGTKFYKSEALLKSFLPIERDKAEAVPFPIPPFPIIPIKVWNGKTIAKPANATVFTLPTYHASENVTIEIIMTANILGAANRYNILGIADCKINWVLGKLCKFI